MDAVEGWWGHWRRHFPPPSVCGEASTRGCHVQCHSLCTAQRHPGLDFLQQRMGYPSERPYTNQASLWGCPCPEHLPSGEDFKFSPSHLLALAIAMEQIVRTSSCALCTVSPHMPRPNLLKLGSLKQRKFYGRAKQGDRWLGP